MASVYDVDPSELIEKASEELKKVSEIKPPAWAPFVKTGMHKERPPVKKDWWYARTASILRTIYRLGPIGVSKLRGKYGGKKNRGYKPAHTFKGSGNIARKVLQQLEKAGFVKQEAKGVHKGRVITGKGKSLLDKIATQIFKNSNQVKKVVKEEHKADKKSEVKEEKKAEQKPKEEKKVVVKPAEKQKEVKKVDQKEKPKEKNEVKQEQKEKPVEKPKEEKKTEVKPAEKPKEVKKESKSEK